MLFLSHSGIDREAAKNLRNRILSSPEVIAQGFEVYIDLHDLRAGTRWKDQLQDALSASTAFAVYVGSRGVLNWVWDEVSVALDRVHHDPNYPLIPILSPDADSSRLPRFLRQFEAVRNVENDSAQFGRLLRAILRLDAKAPLVLEGEPFRGLAAFDSTTASLFYGRERESLELLETVRSETLVAVVGESGSGKSSLVKAGLVPRFRRGALANPGVEGNDERAWQAIEMRPGGHPFRRLTDALGAIAREQNWTPAASEELAQLISPNNPDGVRRAIRMIAPAGASILLVIDQFEESFTLVDASERRPFVDLLLTLADPTDASLRVVLTMRLDYYHLCSTIPALYERLERNDRRARFNLAGMSAEGLRACIEKPLELAGRPAAEGRALADIVLRDVGQRPNNLALLEMALTRAWAKRADYGGDMVDAYIAIGRIDGALAQAADEVIDHKLTPEERKFAEPLFVRLVKLGDTGGAGRRIARREELGGAGDDPNRVVQNCWDLAQKLAGRDCERLVVTSEATVELTHEALVTSWGRYLGWLTNNQETGELRGDDKRRLDQLMEAERRWRDADAREKTRLLANDADLTQFQALGRTRPNWLSPGERTFVAASAAAKTRRTLLARGMIAGVGVLAVSAIGLAYVLAGSLRTSQGQVAALNTQVISSRLGRALSPETNLSGLQMLAGADGETRSTFVDGLLVDPLLQEKFRDEPNQVLRALTGLDLERRNAILTRLGPLSGSGDPPSAIAALIALLLEDKDAGFLGNVARLIASIDVPDSSVLAEAWKAQLARLPNDDAGKLADLIATLIRQTENPSRVSILAAALPALTIPDATLNRIIAANAASKNDVRGMETCPMNEIVPNVLARLDDIAAKGLMNCALQQLDYSTINLNPDFSSNLQLLATRVADPGYVDTVFAWVVQSAATPANGLVRTYAIPAAAALYSSASVAAATKAAPVLETALRIAEIEAPADRSVLGCLQSSVALKAGLTTQPDYDDAMSTVLLDVSAPQASDNPCLKLAMVAGSSPLKEKVTAALRERALASPVPDEGYGILNEEDEILRYLQAPTLPGVTGSQPLVENIISDMPGDRALNIVLSILRHLDTPGFLVNAANLSRALSLLADRYYLDPAPALVAVRTEVLRRLNALQPSILADDRDARLIAAKLGDPLTEAERAKLSEDLEALLKTPTVDRTLGNLAPAIPTVDPFFVDQWIGLEEAKPFPEFARDALNLLGLPLLAGDPAVRILRSLQKSANAQGLVLDGSLWDAVSQLGHLTSPSVQSNENGAAG